MSNANESAFPLQWDEARCLTSGGLTKREMFAMAAMQGLLASDIVHAFLKARYEQGASNHGENTISVSAVGMADALLAELERTSGGAYE